MNTVTYINYISMKLIKETSCLIEITPIKNSVPNKTYSYI